MTGSNDPARERALAMLESIADGLFVLDRDWRLTYVNRPAEFLLERDRDELLGKTLWEAFPEDDSRLLRAELERARAEHDVAEFEEFHPSLGSWLEYRAFPADDGLSVYVRDVTDRKVAEEALRRSEERVRIALQAAGMAHWDRDLRSGEVLWSPEHSRILGLPPGVSRASSEAFLERVHPDDRARVDRALSHAVETGEDFQAEFRVVHPDGELRWVAEFGRALYDAAGRPARMLGVTRDITPRKHEEETARFLARASELLVSSLDYRATVQSVADLCAGTLADYCIVHVLENGEVRAPGIAHADPARTEILRGLLRRFPVEMEGPHPVLTVLRSGEARLLGEIGEEVLEEIASGPEHLEMLRDLDLSSGMIVPLRARGRTLGAISCWRSGSAPRYGRRELEVAEELARRAALAVDNARLYREARQATRSRDEMLAVVSHDLRNPLHAVLLAATILDEFSDAGAWSARDRKQLEIIRHSTEQMTRLILDLVEVVSLESGSLSLQRARVEVEPVVGGVLDMFEPMAAEQGIRMETRVAPGLPAVEADRARLLQLFSNLVGNALKFTPRGGTVTLEAAPEEGGVRFAVRDTGPGIPREHFPHIFDRFWQAQRDDRRGLGLGLAIAKGIAETHGGRIWVESEPGAGSAFFFTLPASA